MEDVPEADDEEMKTERKKRRSGDFFMERVRFFLGQSRSRETGEEEDEKSEGNGKKKSFLEKWRNKLFKRIVLPPALITQEKITILETASAETPKITAETSFLPEDAPANTAVAETAHENEQITVEHEPLPEEGLLGELIIQHDPEEEPVATLPEVIPVDEVWKTYEVEAKEAASAAGPPPEHIGNIVKRMEQRDATVFNRNEILSRSRDKKLERESRKLKKRITEAGQEQKTLQQEQKDFKTQVEKELHRPVLVERLVEKQESQRKSLQANRGMVRPAAPEASYASVRPPELTEVQLAIPTQPEQLKAFVTRNEQDRPETVLHKVEQAAEKDIPIENAYERRHEIKDEEGEPVVSLGRSRGFGGGHAYAPVPMPPVPASYIEQRGVSAANPANPLQSLQQDSMYGGAVKSGFWTAVALLAIMFVIYVAR